ncbi:MAG: DNA translocase FtsK [Chloroflexi bacterium]|nr:DNA translocase FtsK [Chloroflexota bacterium]
MSKNAEVKQRKYETIGLILLAIGLIALLDMFFLSGDNHVLHTIVGVGALPLAVTLTALGAFITFRRLAGPLLGPHWHGEAILGIELIFVAALTMLHMQLGSDNYAAAFEGRGGGLMGWSLSQLLTQAVGATISWVLLIVLAVLGLILIFEYTPLRMLNLPLPRLPDLSLAEAPEETHYVGESPVQEPTRPVTKKETKTRSSQQKSQKKTQSSGQAPARVRRSKKLPPLSLLQIEDSGGSGEEQAQIQAHIIEDTLSSFGIPAVVTEVNIGPTVTQFGISPGTYERAGRIMRVRVNKIVSLSDDLSLALAASPVRIEAPVPGRPFLGIEVPNPDLTLVSLRGILEDKDFRRTRSPLAIPFGRDVSGAAVGEDLHSLPHLLIAGATGSGKSVALNAIICALLFNNLPSALQLILVDPKRVELPGYNGIPHLLAPVVTDPQHAEGALTWLLIEMDERYRRFSEKGVRNIGGYNRKVGTKDRLPYIVTIIDELADLMVTAPDNIEAKLVRLAQMARATGIHLIIATQRPSVDIVTGLIKANFPARLAFAVTSQIDSRVIIDSPGADKLLGRGDGLLMTADSSKLRRIQGCFVSDSEINALAQWWKEQIPGNEIDSTQPRYPWNQLMVDEANADDMLYKATETVRGRQSITTSSLQRLMGIGYPKAAKLMEQLEAEGVVGPEDDRRSGRAVLIEDNDLSFE